MLKALRAAAEELGLRRKCPVVEVDCMKQCSHGPMALVYPDAVWYAGLKPRDAVQMAEQHLKEGEPVAVCLYQRAHKREEKERQP